MGYQNKDRPDGDVDALIDDVFMDLSDLRYDVEQGVSSRDIIDAILFIKQTMVAYQKEKMKPKNEMSNTIQQSDEEILANFYAMQEGETYVVNALWFSELNRLRMENKWFEYKKSDWCFYRLGQKLFLNGYEIFDFKCKTNLAFAFAVYYAHAWTFILKNNGLEKMNNNNTINTEHPIVDCFPV